MKLYTFVHTMLKPTHQGVQGMHALADLASKYPLTSTEMAQFQEWASCHHTIIMKDGGPSSLMADIANILMKSPYAWANFLEDEDTAQGLQTAIVFVAPTAIWVAADFYRAYPDKRLCNAGDGVHAVIETEYKQKRVIVDPNKFTKNDWDIIDLCNACKLAQ